MSRARDKSGQFKRTRKKWSLLNFDDGYMDATGRIRVYLPDHHRSSSNGYVLRAIVAYEKYHRVKVPLSRVVHHKNHNRADDSKKNLEMMTREEHTAHHAGLMKNDVQMKCHMCKKPFLIQKWRVEEGRGKYCSQSCYHNKRKLK